MTEYKVRIFLSYSHKDETYFNDLETHLSPLKRGANIETWHDRKISPGEEWQKERNDQLNLADIILLLVSADFIASDFCFCTELEQARTRHEAREARLIPIFLRPIDLDALCDTPIQKLQGLPDPKKPISKWNDREEAYLEVVKGIRKVVNEIIQQKQQEEMSRPSPMRSKVADEHYIEREEEKKFLERFSKAIQEPAQNPLLFNIHGIGGVGKTTLMGRLQQAYAGNVDFFEVCFAKTAEIETPLKLMRNIHNQAIVLFANVVNRDEHINLNISNDIFVEQEKLFTRTALALSQKSLGGERNTIEEERKITDWFERLIWLNFAGANPVSSKLKSSDTSGFGFSGISTLGEGAEGLPEWMNQKVRNHPETKDNKSLQDLMLNPVLKLTQAFADSLIRIGDRNRRSIVVVLDTYEKAQPYLNQWLWQYLVEETSLYSSPVRLVVIGRRSLEMDEGWRKINQDRKLLYDISLRKFAKKETEAYLTKIEITNAGKQARIYKVTQGLPYYLAWVRRQKERGEEPDFSKVNQAIVDLLFQGMELRQQKILKIVACCKWFNLSIIQYLFQQYALELDFHSDTPEACFNWLKDSDFVESKNRKYSLDDVARDVFRQSYFQDDRTQFWKTNSLLAEYFRAHCEVGGGFAKK